MLPTFGSVGSGVRVILERCEIEFSGIVRQHG